MHKLFFNSMKFMKNSPLLILSAIFFCLACTCEKNNKNVNTPIEAKTDSSVSKRKIITRDIPVTMDFFQITNLSSANVVFSNGPFKVYEKGDSAHLNTVGYEFDGGVLTITTPMEANNDMASFSKNEALTVHVSCPELKTVAVCATGGFECHDTIRTDFFQMGGLVKGQIDIDCVVANKFRYESNGSTMLNVGNILCDECVVIATGDGILNLNVNAKTNGYFDIKNESMLNVNVKAPLVEGLIETKRDVNMDIDTKELQLSVLAGTVNLSGFAAKQNIKKAQLATVNNSLKSPK